MCVCVMCNACMFVREREMCVHPHTWIVGLLDVAHLLFWLPSGGSSTMPRVLGQHSHCAPPLSFRWLQRFQGDCRCSMAALALSPPPFFAACKCSRRQQGLPGGQEEEAVLTSSHTYKRTHIHTRARTPLFACWLPAGVPGRQQGVPGGQEEDGHLRRGALPVSAAPAGAGLGHLVVCPWVRIFVFLMLCRWVLHSLGLNWGLSGDSLCFLGCFSRMYVCVGVGFGVGWDCSAGHSRTVHPQARAPTHMHTHARAQVQARRLQDLHRGGDEPQVRRGADVRGAHRAV